MAYHTAFLRESREELRKLDVSQSEEVLVETHMGDPVQVSRRLRQVTTLGGFMTVQPSTVNSTELGAQ